MNEIGLKFGDGFPEHTMVMLFQSLQRAKSAHPGMAINAVEQKPAMNFLVALLPVQPVIGSDRQDRVSAQMKRLRR